MITFSSLGKLGRLGNQMFQYAATKSAALNVGAKFIIPFDNHQLKDIFDLKCNYYKASESIDLLKNTKKYDEKKFEYDEGFLSIKDGTVLKGYFQSELYFSKHKDIILDDFSFLESIYKPASKYIEKIKSKNTLVSVHIRRGDYVRLEKYHPLCSIDYYKNSMKLFNNCTFIIFSDDLEWCKDNIKGSKVIYSELNNSGYDLCAMSLCDHNIIANSSYSWWGAWLNRNEGKKVIAPKVWFGYEYRDKNTKDIYCKGWVKI
jgi:hypothetical protein